ncbi:LytTR family two component transcriptional regulator [Elizabethkingia sp. YR214]|uniref:LytR/AlgR family response regulator transcription factor n=1 Tax=Elizabethkingia sp. YR214 TaxID=2135667 RepID=UPI000D31CD1C|nr:LytTR family DNA-binding domain-containing protein [Elizabethkingia sp. YR214]PUB33491.1 LytTR family two component transcriptional regulator [Elizabethkingia sp. YR214]
MKYLIVEDERFAYLEIKRMMVRLCPEYVLAGRIESVKETVSFLKNNSVDLILSDIHLADGDCFEIFEQVHVSAPIIFTTAYDEHAIRAFKLNSIDYLLKPIEEEHLAAALKKLQQQNTGKGVAFDYKKIEDVLLGNHKKNRFLVQIGDTYEHIHINEIAFFYSEEKVVFLHTLSNRRYVVGYTLAEIETLLDQKLFFRVSRNCVANITSIKKISKYFNSRLKLIFEPNCPHEILVSRERVSDFLKWVDG